MKPLRGMPGNPMEAVRTVPQKQKGIKLGFANMTSFDVLVVEFRWNQLMTPYPEIHSSSR